jgi:hypothetical protein
MITIAFMADDPAEAAKILEFISASGIEVGARRAGGDTRESARETRSEGPTDDPADGWGDDNQADDPWSDGPSSASSRSRSSAPSSGPWADIPRSGEHWVDTKNGKRRWEFGLDDAPDCHCGHAAAKVSGKGSKGVWSAWWCALGFSKDHYKSKCEFQEWASKK